MPRLRPLRTKEEIAAVPENESVMIALDPEGTIVLDREADEAALKAQEEAELKAKAQGKTAPKEEPEDDAADLKRQLEDLRKANVEATKRYQDESTARQAAEQRARDREQESSQSKIRAEDAEYDAILNAIGAAESEAEAAQRDIALASEAGDAKLVAEASRKMARAESRLVQLNDGKDAIERAKTAAAAKAKDEPRKTEGNQTQPTVDQYIDQLPNLLPSQRDWLREHPETITNTRINMKLQGAHVEAEDKGLRPGTVKYFAYLEERLGFKEPEEDDDQVDDNDNRRTAATVSAPPSRQATNPGNGRPVGTRITLTPEQREIARLSGIDEITYARQLQKMNELKASGNLQ